MSNAMRFENVTGIAAPLPLVNIDTDMIIPGEFCNVVERTGLAKGLFHGLAYTPDGKPNPDFVLNRQPYRQASFLVAGANFGCGSSREHAPWALLEAGIRAIIAPSFADIFYNNCFKNGILPVILPQAVVDAIMAIVSHAEDAVLTVDLEHQQIGLANGDIIPFTMNPALRRRLLDGLDDILVTLKHEDAIAGFEAHTAIRPISLGPGDTA